MVPGNLIQPVTVIFAIPGTVVTGAQENLVGLVIGLLKQLEVSLSFKFLSSQIMFKNSNFVFRIMIQFLES